MSPFFPVMFSSSTFRIHRHSLLSRIRQPFRQEGAKEFSWRIGDPGDMSGQCSKVSQGDTVQMSGKQALFIKGRGSTRWPAQTGVIPGFRERDGKVSRQ